MIFSADWYPGVSLFDWKLPGAEIIIDKRLFDIYYQMVEKNIYLTLHSPMSVSIGSKKSNIRYLSTNTICDNLEYLRKLQPNSTARIVVHAANFSDRTPEEIWEVQRKTLWSLWFKMKERRLLDSCLICIENLGKISQVGAVEDITRLCNLTDNFIPCIDFGHLHGRSLGKFLNSKEDFNKVFQQLYSELPAWKVDNMHIHFSKLEYTDKGEKKHVPFSSKEMGPKPAHFIRSVSDQPNSFNPVIVCESPNPHVDGCSLRHNFECRQNSLSRCF